MFSLLAQSKKEEELDFFNEVTKLGFSCGEIYGKLNITQSKVLRKRDSCSVVG